MYFIIKPNNISVLSEASVSARVYALMTVLKGMVELEFLCLNSRENFEDNKRFLRSRIEQEDNLAVRKLLEADLTHLDRIQVQMATHGNFYLLSVCAMKRKVRCPVSEPYRKDPARAGLFRKKSG